MLERIAATPIRNLDQGALLRMGPGETVARAVQKMIRYRRGAVIVQDDAGHLVGIFTERDVLRHGAQDNDWAGRTLGECMTRSPVTICENDTVAEALRRMKEGHFRHLPVVNEAGRPTGLISIRDILAYVAYCFREAVLNLPPDPSLEARERWGG